MGNYTPPEWEEAPDPTPSGYKPPTEVVVSDRPYLSLVTKVDPLWANLKYREVEYEFTGRVIRYNPYFTAAYSGLTNTYTVGSQWGGADPNFVALSSTNLGAVAQSNSQSVSLTLPSAVAAGSLIAILVADSSFSGPIPASAVSDGANTYERLFSSPIGLNGSPLAVIFALTIEALGQGATLKYTSPGSPSASNSIAMAAVAVTGGVQPTVFDAEVSAQNFAQSGAPTVTSGNPEQQLELFIGFCVTATDTSFTADGTHGWLSLQQGASGGSGALTVCSSTQSGGVFDPGTNASVIFSPGMAATMAPWTAIVLGVLPTKPMYAGTNDGAGWA